MRGDQVDVPARGMRVNPSGESGRAVGAIVLDIVSVLLPPYPPIDVALRRQVERDVAAYVAAQIEAMPGFMRLPYKLTLLGFEWLPVLRYGRRFSGLTAARQTSYLARWSDAPLLPMRDFVKLIRSSALLVYFDHPLLLPYLDATQTSPAGGDGGMPAATAQGIADA